MRRYGFTLIEMLVVTGIIAIFIAILLPVLQNSRLRAKGTVCISNIRQLDFIICTYAADNGRFPYGYNNQPGLPLDEDPGYYQYNRKGWWWFNYLKKLYKNNIKQNTILNCPSRKQNNSDLEKIILCGNYGVNLSICKMSAGKQINFTGEPRTITELPHPSQTLLLLDSGYSIIGWKHAADDSNGIPKSALLEDSAYVPGLSINHSRQLWQGQEIDAYYGRHSQLTDNVGFADGHVIRMKAEELLVKKIKTNQYQNQVPLWTPLLNDGILVSTSK